MQEWNVRLGKRLRAAVGVLLIGSAIGAPAMAAPNALSRAREKQAQMQAAAEAKAAEAKAAEEAKAAAGKAALEALVFNPFAGSLNASGLPKGMTSEEAARRLMSRIRLLQRAGMARTNRIMLAQVVAARRSPNTPPPYTDPRPSDPPRPDGNVAPGPE